MITLKIRQLEKCLEDIKNVIGNEYDRKIMLSTEDEYLTERGQLGKRILEIIKNVDLSI